MHVIKTMRHFGSNHTNARLKPGDIAKIMYFHHRRTYSLSILAVKFGVSRGHIKDICMGRAWRCLFDKEYLRSGASDPMYAKKSPPRQS